MIAGDSASSGLLNSYAWRMTELELNLEDALTKIRRAVDLAREEGAETLAQLWDTEAEVLWKLGHVEEAVMLIERCITLQPDDSYYQEQKAKFHAGRIPS